MPIRAAMTQTCARRGCGRMVPVSRQNSYNLCPYCVEIVQVVEHMLKTGIIRATQTPGPTGPMLFVPEGKR